MQVTLKNLHEATAQQVYDQVARHLLKQNAQSLGYGKCLYRGTAIKTNTPAMCAAGCLISDEEYKKYGEDFERMGGWLNLIEAGAVTEMHSLLIQGLQQIHDCRLPHAWADDLRKLANVHGLSSAVIDEVQNAN